jgi:hypothetical protein
MYLRPTKTSPVQVDAALHVLRNYFDVRCFLYLFVSRFQYSRSEIVGSQKVDTVKALELLPAGTKVADVHAFLTAVIRERFAARRRGELLGNLLKADRLRVHEELLALRARRITVDDDKLCLVCRRPLRRSAFACYPNGVVVHVACFTDADTCPCSNLTCRLSHAPSEARLAADRGPGSF